MSLVGTSDSMPRERALAPACQTFPFFTLLPAELRLKIWEYNLPGSRVVPVQCGSRSASLLPDWAACSQTAVPARIHVHGRHQTCPSPPPRPWCTSPAAIPANLHACHESRVEALRRYARMFGIARQRGHVYFDAAHDVLYFGPRPGYMASEAQLRTLLALADPDELQQVRRVAVHEALFWEAAGTPGEVPGAPSPGPSSPAFWLATNTAVDVLHLLRTRLPRLRELILVPRDQIPGPSIDAALVPLTGRRHAAASIAYLGLQVQEAMRRMRTTIPDWSPPPWTILALSGSAAASPPPPPPPPPLRHRPVLDCSPTHGSRPVPGAPCSAAYLGPGLSMSTGQGRPLATQPAIHPRRQRLPSLAAVFPYGSRGAVLPPAVASSFSRVSQTGVHFMMQFRDLDE